MTHRERVMRAFAHQETDRVPMDFGGTVVTCLDVEAHRRLKEHMGMEPEPGPIIDYTMGTVVPDERILRELDVDFRRVGLNVIPPEVRDYRYTNGFGMILAQAVPHPYFDVVHHPLAEAGIKELADMLLPDPEDDRLYVGLRDRAREIYENTDYAIVADFGVPGFYETAQKLRGYEQFACDLLLEPKLVQALFDRLLELQKRFFKRYLEQVNGYAAVIGYADDLGMQDRLQMSPATYREIIKPYHKEIWSYIHSISDVKIMLHSCGAIMDVIPDLIDAGLDILNPIQTRATGMDPGVLKERFGDKLIFWGGVDEQVLLPTGTPAEIRAEAEKLSRTLGASGGYVLAASHNIQADTPSENILAIYR